MVFEYQPIFQLFIYSSNLQSLPPLSSFTGDVHSPSATTSPALPQRMYALVAEEECRLATALSDADF